MTDYIVSSINSFMNENFILNSLCYILISCIVLMFAKWLFKKAIKYDMYEEITSQDMNSEFYIKRAEVNVMLENLDDALKDYSMAIEQNGDDVTLFLGKANILYEMGEYEAAIADYDVYLKESQDPIALGNRGYCHFMLEELDAALEDMNGCIELEEDYAWAYYTRGQILQELEKFEEAREDYEKANSLMNKEK